MLTTPRTKRARATTPPSESRRWFALALLSTAFFMVILDTAIVNVALPSIQADLGFSTKNLQWVVSAYALTFGGLLLLGGRAADLLGRRRVFVTGVALFGLASLLGGFAWSETAMVTARALQGIGAAAMTPAALSIITTTFREGAERNKALGVWGSVGAAGGSVGLLIGGVLTDTVGWEWIFFANLPVTLGVIALTPMLIAESGARTGTRRFDIAGAVTVTAAIALLVFGIVDAGDAGWASAQTLGLFLASAALLGVFVGVERRSNAPLLPFRIFRLRSLVGANAAGFALMGAMFGVFFLITLYLQQVLGYSPLESGFAWLTMSVTVLVSAMGGQLLVTKIGARVPLVAGALVTAVGIWLLAGIPANGSYTSDLLPGMIVAGIGLGLAFVAMTVSAVEGVAERDAGLASGLINTSQQVGAALGVAILSSVALSRTSDILAADPSTPQAHAVTEGFSAALTLGAVFAAASAILAAFLMRARRSTAAVEAAVPDRLAPVPMPVRAEIDGS